MTASAAREPVALVGIGCRFPGAPNPSAFWRLVADGVDAVREVPPDRWDVEALYDPDASKPGKVMSKWGGYLDDVDLFDWRAFRISPREAKFMDPQHRLLLEVAWEALEDAGIPFENVAGSPTSVFVGIMWNDYAKLAARDWTKLEGYNANGNSFAYSANRISYFLDLKGPSVAIDVQCASSLTAVHLACASLWSGESTLAMAGGVNLIISPDTNIAMSKASILSPDGRCKTWDASANGFVRGEGAGIVVLKPLSAALADGDRVYAVIRSSVVTHGGKTDWIMAPSREGQEALLREAYRQAGIDPRTVDYVELHGTGTKVGDPIEAAALGAVVGAGRDGRRCKVGTVKTNIGHLDSAAGIAGLVKTALAIHRRQIPPSLHFDECNPAIPVEELGLEVQTELAPWPEDSPEPLAGVTGLSFGGGHAHVVLSAAPAGADERAGVRPPSRPHVLPLSAKSDEALRLLAAAYRDHLGPGGEGAALDLLDVCHTAGARRSHHEHRAAVVFRSRAELLDRLDALARGEARPGVAVGKAAAGGVRPVFVFSGQGVPWWGSGRELLALEPVFRRAVAACDQRMRPHARWSLLDELTRDQETSRLAHTAFAQPATFALQSGLAALWRSWGVEPAAVIGHSVGEVAAAASAGAVSAADAARLVVYRGQLMKNAPAHPAMAAVLLPLAEVEALVEPYGPKLAVAADNAPSATLVSGETAAVEKLLAECRERGVYATALPEHDVFHRAPAAYGEALGSWLGEWAPQAGAAPLFSTVTGQACEGPELDTAYWSAQMSHRVEFRAAVEAALDAGFDTFVELGAHPVLAGPLAECLRAREADGLVVSSLRRGEDEQPAVLDALCQLYVRGLPVAWSEVEAGPGRPVSLPTHPWIRERLWIDVEAGSDAGAGATGGQRSGHPLLGTHVRVAVSDQQVWEAVHDRRRLRWLDDHKVQGVVVMAGAGFVEMVVSAVQEALGWDACVLRDIELRKALVLPDQGGRRVQLVLGPASGEGLEFRVLSRPTDGEAWALHVQGVVEPDAAGGPGAPVLDVDEARRPLHEEVPGPACYRRFEEQGEQYGPAFQGIAHLWRRDGEVLAQMLAPTPITADLPRFRFHPALLDACMHALVMAASEEEGEGGFMPTRIAEIRATGRLDTRAWSHVRLVRPDEDEDGQVPTGEVDADITIVGEDGAEAMRIRGLHLRFLDRTALQAPLEERWYYEVAWDELPAADGAAAPEGPWLVLADEGGVGEALAARLGECVVVRAGDDLEAALEGLPDCRGVVHLWSLDAPSVDEADAESVERAQALGCGAALRVVQAVSGRRGRTAPRLTLVTRGCQAVTPEDPPPEAIQGAIWGFGRSLAQERPELWGGLLDLDPSVTAAGEAAAAVLDHLGRGDGEDQCARRGGATYGARLVRARPPGREGMAVTWRPDAAYLVTGGLGDLGLAAARWMAEQGARHLVLMGRTPLPPREQWREAAAGDDVAAARIAAVRQIEALGAAVHVAAVDVGDEAALRGFLDRWDAEGRPPVRGVLHAAGVAPFEAVEQMTVDGMQSVLRPKVSGGWLLHKVLEDRPVDVFVLFSSASGVLSSPRLAHYAGGNSFLDALAHHRHRRGLPALSVNWGPWAEVGMATRTGAGGPASLRGMHLIPVDAGFDALARMMATGATHLAVLPIEWDEWRQSYAAAAAAPILRPVVGAADDEGEGEDAVAAAGGPPAVGALDALLALAPDERAASVAATVVEQVTGVLRVPADQLAGQSLAELGFDSLLAMELRSRLNGAVGVDLSILEILEAATAEQLGALVGERVEEAVAAMGEREPALAAPVASAPAADGDVGWVVELLSDAEVEALLAELAPAGGGA